MGRRRIWAFITAGIVMGGVGQFALRGIPRSLTFDAVELAGALAVFAGIRWFHPRDEAAWRFLGAGLLMLALGDFVWDGLNADNTNRSASQLSNVVYLAAYGPLLWGLLKLARDRIVGDDREALADGAIVSVAAIIPAWQFLMEPALSRSLLSTFDEVAAVLFPLLDLVLIAALSHMLLSSRVRALSFWLLFGGLFVTLAGDVAFLWFLPEPTTPEWVAILWPLSYLVMGSAALHPSMRALSEPAPLRRPELGRTRVTLLASALFVGPAVVVSENIRHREVDMWVLGPVSALVVALVMWRLVRLAGSVTRNANALRDSEERFRSLVQHASDVIVVVDENGRFEYVSPAVDTVLGLDADALTGSNILDRVHSEDRDLVRTVLQETLRDRSRSFTFEARVRHHDGQWRWIEASCSNYLEQPSVRGIVANVRDITDRKRVELSRDGESHVLSMIARAAPISETLGTLAEAVESQLDGARCAVLIADELSGTLRHGAAPHLPEEFVDSLDPVPLGVDGGSSGLAATLLEPVYDDGSDAQWKEYRELSAAFGFHACWSTPIVAPESSRLLGTIAVHLDHARRPTPEEQMIVQRATAVAAIAIDRAAAEDRLEYLALHDPLTQLPNRSLVLDRLSRALLRLDRRQSTLAVLFLDLDRFKVINDSLGHDAGDELLIGVGHRLTEVLRPSDTVARLGGDEFVVVCEDIGDDRDAVRIAERIGHALSQPFSLDDGDVVVTASLGIALSHDPDDRSETLLRDADAAMYRAKDRGRARYEIFNESLRSHAVVRLLIERALRRAVDRDELRVFFQPIVDLKTNAIVAAEALLRWAHPVRGLVTPDEFIGVAEETGLIIPIGAWVLQEACRQADEWATSGPNGTPIRVSVNLSARQLLRTDLAQAIARVLDAQGTAHDRLCLEITESAILEDVEGTAEALMALRSTGVKISVDDFGTGYSSLAYLKRFPFDELKIDQGFVEGLGRDTADDAIVAASIQMAHALGMTVAAEGVETELQLQKLQELGCDLAQGYYFYYPTPASQIEALAKPDTRTASA